MKLDVILRVTTKLLMPFMLTFALYVHFHADFGAGGGFQAGVIAAAAVILYALIFGLEAAKAAVPMRLVELLVPLGVVIYAGVGVYGMLTGVEFLNYSTVAYKPDKAQHYGIILIEIGVLVTVASSMVALFYMFAGRGR